MAKIAILVHLVGGWFNTFPPNGQGDAGQDPPNQNLQVLFLQLSVSQGESSTGVIGVLALINDEVVLFLDQTVDCVAVSGCQGPEDCDDGEVCDPATGECVVDQDPCECVSGTVTLCHIPPGNPANAHTITVGCAARDTHLAHGDTCGPCTDGMFANAESSATGSCCFTDDCFVVTEAGCAATGGKYAGDLVRGCPGRVLSRCLGAGGAGRRGPAGATGSGAVRHGGTDGGRRPKDRPGPAPGSRGTAGRGARRK